MRLFENRSDVALVAAYQSGEEHVLYPLLENYKALLHTLSRRLCCPHPLTEELIQSGYVGLIRAAQEFNPSYNVRFITYAVPWILGEMKRTLRLLLSNTMDYSLDSSKESETIFQKNLVSNENIDIEYIDLRIALQKLDGEERTLILLRYFRGKTQSEAAHLLKKSQAQVSRTEQRILEKLRKNLC